MKDNNQKKSSNNYNAQDSFSAKLQKLEEDSIPISEEITQVKKKTVQIDQDLFDLLCLYFCSNEKQSTNKDYLEKLITYGLKQKMKSIEARMQFQKKLRRSKK